MTDGPVVEGSYCPGERVVVAANDVWLIAEIDPAHDAVARWWASARAGSDAREMLALVLDEGFRDVPTFAIVGYDATARTGTLVVRGDVTAHVVAAESTAVYAADHGSPWQEVDLDDTVVTVELARGEPEVSAVRLPLTSGVTIASSIRIALRAPEPGVEPIPAPVPEPPVADVVVPEVEAPVPAPVTIVEAQPESAHEPPTFDFLFGATQHPPTEVPVSWNTEVDDVDAMASVEDAPASVARPVPTATPTETLQPTDTMYPAPADPADEPQLIAALPWEIPPPAPASVAPAVAEAPTAPLPVPVPPTAPPVASLPQPVAEAATVNRAALLAAAASQHVGPTVKAIRCPQGHLSPPVLDACRVCTAPLTAQDAFTAPRPVLGTIRLSNGDVVTLDRGVVLGRAPESHAGENAADRPHVVKLASPENDISRNHLEIRLDGWHVLVVDLDSVNGTVVTPPDQDPQRLRPHDALSIEPGTLVTLADEVSFVYEVGA